MYFFEGLAVPVYPFAGICLGHDNPCALCAKRANGQSCLNEGCIYYPGNKEARQRLFKQMRDVEPIRKLEETQQKENDPVNHPNHYCVGRFECFEVMQEVLGVDAVQSFCKCNAFKYLFRAQRKNGLQDIEKAKWYLEKYIELERSKEDGREDTNAGGADQGVEAAGGAAESDAGDRGKVDCGSSEASGEAAEGE